MLPSAVHDHSFFDDSLHERKTTRLSKEPPVAPAHGIFPESRDLVPARLSREGSKRR